MAKLPRVTQREFGINGPVGDFGQFGSLKLGTKVFTKDLASIQSLNNFLTGWNAAVIGGFRPALEDMNSLFFLVFQQLCYMFQSGIPEWDSATTYYTNGIVQKDGVIYLSKVNDNLGNDPASSVANWDYPPGSLPSGAQIAYGATSAPAGFLSCNGAAVSRTTYARLFNVIGVRYGAGNGSTTFNLPDKRGRVSVGYDSTQTEFNLVGKQGGEKTHILTIPEMPSHGHGYLQSPWQGSRYSGNESPVVTGQTGGTTDSTGGGEAHNNLQPYETDLWIIRI